MDRLTLARPTLLPGLPRVWRTPNTLQLGLDSRRGVLLDLPDPRVASVLDLLDGTRSERMVFARAVDDGLPSRDVRALLDSLHEAGLVLSAPQLFPPSLPEAARHRLSSEAATIALRRPAPDQRPGPAPPEEPSPAQILRRRGNTHVVVRGRGRLGIGIAVALAQSGIGHLHPELAGTVALSELAGAPLRDTDVGRSRDEAAADAVRRAEPQTQIHSVRRAQPALIVQLGYDQPAALLAAAYLRRRQPHLLVIIREGTVVVGPIISGTGRPCLFCMDLHRRDRDPEWPDVSAQLPDTGPEPCAVTTVLAATAYAAAQVLAFVDEQQPETMGASMDISSAGKFRRRTWPPHPDCYCGRLRSRPRSSPPPARPAPSS